LIPEQNTRGTRIRIIDPDQIDISVYRFDQDSKEPVAKFNGQQEISSPLLRGLSIRLPEIFRRG